MKYFYSFLFSLLSIGVCTAGTPLLPLVPYPQEVAEGKGFFNVSKQLHIVCSDPRLLNNAEVFRQQLTSLFSIKATVQVKIVKKLASGTLYLQLDSTLSHKDEYDLTVTPAHVLLKGNQAGVFYGLQSLVQLMAPQPSQIPAVRITDFPRFLWRGMHLDVSRHFFPVPFIKKYIATLALHKMNTFHWHLTDDQGWRIEIKKYPRLTEIGSRRAGSQVGRYSEQKFDSTVYGGFYTQEEIKDIVAYAAARHVTVVPEIEMPGHSLAALAAYPTLACRDSIYEVAKGWGVFEDVYCPEEETFNFLGNVLNEVMDLFPSTYIHIGGDECPKETWKRSDFAQELMKREGLKDEHELQSYFIRRVEKMVNARGRQIIGWDEILEGGLAPNAAVMSWRGTAGGIAAATQHHYVVMTPGSHCYFDHYQSRPDSLEPIAIGGFTPVEKVYAYEPVPDTLQAEERKYVLGAQGNVWTEYITTPEHAEYMALPRMCALAEVLWLEAAKKDEVFFKARLAQHAKLLDRLKINYAKHALNKP